MRLTLITRKGLADLIREKFPSAIHSFQLFFQILLLKNHLSPPRIPLSPSLTIDILSRSFTG